MTDINYALTCDVNGKRVLISKVIGSIEIRGCNGSLDHLAAQHVETVIRGMRDPMRRMLAEELERIQEKEGSPT